MDQNIKTYPLNSSLWEGFRGGPIYKRRHLFLLSAFTASHGEDHYYFKSKTILLQKSYFLSWRNHTFQ